ncbi:hypothetical protein ABT354_26645 [Streptomyces sp. NPDC000594]|uniref:anti-sigma factor family protein n=1 Tax=Streptomyces sp. NPDC000594 TaxID=3154261 RepID=UPI00331907B6
MTSTADSTQHPDVSEISDLTEGLLPPARSTELRQHLDACELCADVRASLEEIRGLLGTLPGASRMPADVAERIDAALAAEALLASTAPDTAPATAHGTAPATAPGDVSRETSPAVPVAEPSPARETAPGPLVPAQSVPSPESHSAERPASDRPAGHTRGAAGPGRRPRARRGRRALSAVLAVAAIGVSVLLIQSFTGTESPQRPNTTDQTVTTPLGATTEFSGSRLEDHVRALASPSSPVPPRTRDGSGFHTHELGPSPLKGATTAPPCVERATGRTDPPLGVEAGTYRGTDAFLFVYTDPTDPDQLLALVIGAECTDSEGTSSGKVLFRHSYPRG